MCDRRGGRTYRPPAVCSKAPSSAGITKCVTFTTSLLFSSWKSHNTLTPALPNKSWLSRRRSVFSVSYLSLTNILSKLSSHHLPLPPLLCSSPLGFQLHLQTDQGTLTLHFSNSFQRSKVLKHHWSACCRTLMYCFRFTYMWTRERNRTRLCLILT